MDAAPRLPDRIRGPRQIATTRRPACRIRACAFPRVRGKVGMGANDRTSESLDSTAAWRLRSISPRSADCPTDRSRSVQSENGIARYRSFLDLTACPHPTLPRERGRAQSSRLLGDSGVRTATEAGLRGCGRLAHSRRYAASKSPPPPAGEGWVGANDQTSGSTDSSAARKSRPIPTRSALRHSFPTHRVTG